MGRVVRGRPFWQTRGLIMNPTQARPPEAPEAAESSPPAAANTAVDSPRQPALPREIGGRDGPEPTRFGDWEKAGRCIDF
jgi:hypothetical protein